MMPSANELGTAAQNNHQCPKEDQIKDSEDQINWRIRSDQRLSLVEQEKKGLHRQTPRIHIQMRSVDLQFV